MAAESVAPIDVASVEVGDVLEDPPDSEDDIDPGKLRQISTIPAVKSGIKIRAAALWSWCTAKGLVMA